MPFLTEDQMYPNRRHMSSRRLRKRKLELSQRLGRTGNALDVELTAFLNGKPSSPINAGRLLKLTKRLRKYLKEYERQQSTRTSRAELVTNRTEVPATDPLQEVSRELTEMQLSVVGGADFDRDRFQELTARLCMHLSDANKAPRTKP